MSLKWSKWKEIDPKILQDLYGLTAEELDSIIPHCAIEIQDLTAYMNGKLKNKDE